MNGVYKKISQTLALFRRLKQFLPQWSRILFYNSYIMPHLDYCVTVWGDCSDVARLEKLQKQAARIILHGLSLSDAIKGHVQSAKMATIKGLGDI